MITHLHGMSETAYKNFIAGNSKSNGPWNVSDNDGMTYLYSVSKLEENEGLDDLEQMEQHAIESAIIQAACKGDEYLYVFHCNLSEYGDVSDDLSCENMDGLADCIPESSFKDTIVSVKKFKWNKYLSPFVINNLKDMRYFDCNNVNEDVLLAANAVYGESYIKEMYYVEFIEEFNFAD